MNESIGSLKPLAHLRTKIGRRRFHQGEVSHSTMLVDTGDEPSCFLKDEVSLLGSKAVRRLSRKTQVTSFPLNPNIRDRMSHTLEVMAVAVNIAELLGLNVELTRAIALGHDIGHVPFGHQGEKYLAERTELSFTHEVMGVVVAQHIERRGKGLNLTHEVLDGMMRHSGKNVSETMTPEAWVVRYADKIAYIFADYNDFQRMNSPLIGKGVVMLMNDFGDTQRRRVRTAIEHLWQESLEKNRVSFGECEMAKKFEELRKLMYGIYPRITDQDPRHILDRIYKFIEDMQICEPLLMRSLMTDNDLAFLSQQPMMNAGHIKSTSVGELLEFLDGKKIDCCNPDLEW